MKKKYPVTLTQTERDYLQQLIAAGTAPTRRLTHARILLKADQGPEGPGWVDERIAEAVEVSQPTVARVRKQYAEEGLECGAQPTGPATGIPSKAGWCARSTSDRAGVQYTPCWAGSLELAPAR